MFRQQKMGKEVTLFGQNEKLKTKKKKWINGND